MIRSIRLILFIVTLSIVACGCEKGTRAPLKLGHTVEAVDNVVEKFSKGGDGWGRSCFPKIKQQILAITNDDERASTIIASADIITSMKLLDLPQRERIAVTPKYWSLTSQFYNLLVEERISDSQRLKYLVAFLKTFKDLCFSLPLCERKSTETEVDFLERQRWAKDLYIDYRNFASRWHRIYRPNLLRSIPSISESDFDGVTKFVCDYPIKETFLSSPVFKDSFHVKAATPIKSPVFHGQHPIKYSEAW